MGSSHKQSPARIVVNRYYIKFSKHWGKLSLISSEQRGMNSFNSFDNNNSNDWFLQVVTEIEPESGILTWVIFGVLFLLL